MAEVQKTTRFDLMLLLGDNVYESGRPRDFFTKLYDPYKNLAAAGVLIKGVVGNHDVRSAEGTALQMKFLTAATVAEQAKFFTLPIDQQEKLPGGTSTYYSFSRSNDLAEFFALDSSMLTDDCCGPFSSRAYPPAEKQKQIEWLRTALNNSTAKWKIVILHHPLYS
ncbi:MAG: metallophosphoesterase, partial [Acidobacteria bacterium]|nr:metallophosphoesterase [Acidobacteriota bacterium]